MPQTPWLDASPGGVVCWQWENLEVSSVERFVRRFIANIFTVLLLLVSFAVVISLATTKQQNAGNSPKFGLCEQEIPALFLGGYQNVSSGLSFVRPGPFDCPNCDVDCANLWTPASYAVYSYQVQPLMVIGATIYKFRLLSVPPLSASSQYLLSFPQGSRSPISTRPTRSSPRSSTTSAPAPPAPAPT
jgi:hypothetical protein